MLFLVLVEDFLFDFVKKNSMGRVNKKRGKRYERSISNIVQKSKSLEGRKYMNMK